ncbi:Sister chromatid cohesion protein pds5 [Pyricularia oryzae]
MAPTRRSRAAAAAAAKAAVVEEEHEEEQEVQEEEEEQPQNEQEDEDDGDDPEEELATLQFDQTLTWRAGKPISTGELHRRLDALSKELSELDQDLTDKNSLTKVAKELVSHNLLTHKDKGVKAFVACCLVDILRICAPNAPFTPSQLKDVFSLFIMHTLPALQDPSNTYHTQHKYVLSSLAEVQSIVLLNDIDNNEGLLLHLFSCFFDAVSGPKSGSGERISKDVELHMVELLVTVIDESASLPGKVVDVIMAQFLRAAAPGGPRDKGDVDESQSTLLLKTEPEAYQMAKQVCNSCPDKMARFVTQYFSDVVMDVTNVGGSRQRGDDSEDEHMTSGPTESDLKELRKAHQLLRELWRACPTILSNVIAHVNVELDADIIPVRQLATETLGDMISGIGAAGPPPPQTIDPAAYPPPSLGDESVSQPTSNVLTTPYSPLSFAQTHPLIYHNFVNRKQDKSAAIRAAWTTAVGYILATSAGGVGLSRDEEAVLIKGLEEKLNDSDERVRLAGVKAVECFSFRDIVTKLAPKGGVDQKGSVLCALADRIRDRKHPIRVEAMVLLGKLWAASTGELVSNMEAVAPLAGIPNKVFNTMYANDPELNLLRERVRFEYLVPLTFPHQPKKSSKSANGGSQSQGSSSTPFDADAIRAHRILLLANSLDSVNKKAFFALSNRQPQFADKTEKFLKVCELNNGGEASGADGKRAAETLNSLITYLAQFYPDQLKVRQDLGKFAKANDRRAYQLIRYVISHESDYKTMHRALRELVKRQQSQNPAVLDSLLPLLYWSGSITFNKSHLSTFLEYSKTNQDGLAGIAHEILNEISQKNPTLFKTHIGSLCKDLQDEAPGANKANDPIMVETLKACASFASKYPQEIPNDKKFRHTLANYAMYGKPPKAAKYAINVLMARKDHDSEVAATDLLQKVMKDFKSGSPHFLNKLATICQLELLAPKVTEDFEDEILHTIHDTLREVHKDASDSDPEWVEYAELDEEGQAKCFALKTFANRLRAITDREEAKTSGDKVIKLLRTFVTNEGEFCKTKDTPLHHKKRLRLLAAQLLLKLCRQFDELLSPDDFNRLAEVAQDGQRNVRHGFIAKLQKYLALGQLRPRWYTVAFLTVYEPDEDFRQNVETWIRSRSRHFRETNSPLMESTLPRLIHLLAHHPDFDHDTDSLVSHARYILFYVSNVASESNLGMLFKYAERTKQTQDALDTEKSENVYTLCDVALAVLRKWQEKRGWTLEAYSNKVGLPVGLFLPLQSHDIAQSIASKQYISEEVEDKLDDMIRAVDRKKKRKYDDRSEQQSTAKKARSQVKSNPRESKPKTPRPSARKPAASRSKSAAKSRKTQAASSSPIPEHERRRSGRVPRNTASTYIERHSSEDEEEMLDGVAEWKYSSGEEDDDGDDSDASSASKNSGHAAATAADDKARNPSESSLSSPEPMDEDPVEEDEGADADSEEQNGEEEEEEETQKRPSRSTRTNGRKAASAATSTPKATGVTKKKAPAEMKSSLATRTKPRSTRRTRTSHDRDDDDD